ncbi:carbohydrate kinase family protein [Sphingomonas sp. MMS24-J13]|uniref:carbohydrate kinase family protein n=1 Tax=Sphingomonas sp. MMS24-J13 TaxID=3238686 RepID=UPI00384FA1B3
MSRVAILGTATADQVFRLSAAFEQEGTIAVRRVTQARAGGAPVYTGAALTQRGHEASPVFDLGDDADGSMILNACRRAGMPIDAIAIQPDGSTSSCLLVYAADGRDFCLFDPGRLASAPLTDAQASAVERAEMVVIAATDASRVEHILDRLRPDQRLVWIFKHDPNCFPDRLCRQLMQRADIVFHNRAEAALVEGWLSLAGPDMLRIRTSGGDGVRIAYGALTIDVPTRSLRLADPTGAGDSFAGYMLAALLDGADRVDAAHKALSATAAFLIDDNRCADPAGRGEREQNA